MGVDNDELSVSSRVSPLRYLRVAITSAALSNFLLSADHQASGPQSSSCIGCTVITMRDSAIGVGEVDTSEALMLLDAWYLDGSTGRENMAGRAYQSGS